MVGNTSVKTGCLRNNEALSTCYRGAVLLPLVAISRGATSAAIWARQTIHAATATALPVSKKTSWSGCKTA